MAEERDARADAAHKSLARWGKVYAERNDRVKCAYAAGIGVNEITRLTGLAKTTVLAILGRGKDR